MNPPKNQTRAMLILWWRRSHDWKSWKAVFTFVKAEQQVNTIMVEILLELSEHLWIGVCSNGMGASNLINLPWQLAFHPLCSLMPSVLMYLLA